jgi:hypothetical protein
MQPNQPSSMSAPLAYEDKIEKHKEIIVSNVPKAGFIAKQLPTRNRRYATDVAYTNSMHYNVNRSYRNDSDITSKSIAQ